MKLIPHSAFKNGYGFVFGLQRLDQNPSPAKQGLFGDPRDTAIGCEQGYRAPRGQWPTPPLRMLCRPIVRFGGTDVPIPTQKDILSLRSWGLEDNGTPYSS
jgi:hypothetical protein